MNLHDYEKKYFSTYEAFAETVRFILEKALLAAENLPRPQSIQCRAKGIGSLRRRLAEAANWTHRRSSLLIFYTNNDVDLFRASGLIHENFEIEEDLTRIHHPTLENKGAQYRAVHYTVRFREDRIRLPEYARFAGLRCEIQVQTILNHAWSETSHDILYKNKLGDGYGGKAMKGIARRFERIMDKYLIPAGFEIQKAQQDYERVIQGKELFDKDIANLLDNAQNNNERYEILSGLRDYAIPNYDDLPAAYEGLKAPLLRVVKAARGTEPVPIETTYGNMEGFKADAVTKLVVEIVKSLRNADVIGTLQLLIDIHRDEPNDDIRQQIVNAVKNLSEYNIDAYNQVGPMLQMALVDHLAGMSDVEVDSIRPIALTVWTEAIQSEITGTTWKADSVVWRTGALPTSDQIREVRDKAIKALFAAYDRSTDDAQKRAVLSALDAATRTPNQTQYSNDLLAVIHDSEVPYVSIDRSTIETMKLQAEGKATKVINLVKAIEKTAEQESDDPFLVAMAERAKAVQESFEDRQTTTEEALDEILNAIERNAQRKKEQASKGLDSLTYFVFSRLRDDGVANSEIVSKKVREAFAQFPNWQQSEKELRELRKKVTFSIFAEEDDLEKVTTLVDGLFTVLQRSHRF